MSNSWFLFLGDWLFCSLVWESPHDGVTCPSFACRRMSNLSQSWPSSSMILYVKSFDPPLLGILCQLEKVGGHRYLEWWQRISEKRCVRYSHSQEDDVLQWGSKGIFYIKKIKNPNPRRWKANSFVDPVLGSLVYQLSEGVTLAYNLCLGRTIARWKGIVEEIHFGCSIKAFDYRWEAPSWKTFI